MEESDGSKHPSGNEKSSAYAPGVKSTVRLAVGGMTCVACVRAITDAVSELEGVSDISVNQVRKSASAVVTGADLVESIVAIIEDIGYECKVISVTPVAAVGTSGRVDKTRSVAVEFHGMEYLPKKIEDILEEFGSNVTILKPYTSDPLNVLRITYTPSAPHFTIRTIISTISITTSTPISAISIWHPPSSDEVSRQMYRKEQKKLLLRLMVAIIAAIPIFIIGIVYMSLLKADNPGRLYFERPIWKGQVARGEWALFIISTPVMFYAAEDFHRRSLQELWFLWKPGSRASWATRFLRFGSMNLLVSLGVSVAYFSSIAELAISASRDPNGVIVSADSTTYFDSVAFLTMFLLIGRFIEAFSKHQAANAITLLGKLRGSDALLLTREAESTSSSTSSLTRNPEDPTHTTVEKISVDLLEVGDIVRVPPGATPPADGTIVSLDATNFDESSLTGESRNVMKTTGDQVFVGTINKLRVVDVRVDAIEGETMLEQVIEAVLQGQMKRAPIERIVDVVTAYFVPVVTTLAIFTWIIWLSLGLCGALPANTLENSVGGWPIWSLEFAIAVFVIACPCGIALAAPTALLVGSGLAAKYGILARGGGEAFQEASQIDVIVFDKTGTLTEGTEPKVTDVIFHWPQSTGKDGSNHQLNDDEGKWIDAIAAIVLQLASTSSHPLCLSLRQHYLDAGGALPAVAGIDIEELPGCGMSGLFRFQSGDGNIAETRALLGNETWLRGLGATSDQDSEQLHRMKSQGKSVVLLALDNTTLDTISTSPGADFSIVAIFAISDEIRPEAPFVISQLHGQGIETWMISGDNEITAQAVARSVGIPSENVIAGVLPQQKAERIRWLQSLPRRTMKKRNHNQKERRKVVAMVGDGINDAPALTAADVGIAMGSGSDIALSSAKFVLLSSNLRTLLILTDLSRKVFRRIKFNFAWATVYNLVALPVAAGVIYPAGHARLSPVWSSLAMALSSTSVVCSSLLLRLYKEPKFSNPDTISEVATPEKKHAIEV
ncbi:heavy metal translocatin [Phlegmacium glaucopus]|nr:heavy metal translocatin [Phlegmacium glaucopus]